MKCRICNKEMVRPFFNWYCPNEDNHIEQRDNSPTVIPKVEKLLWRRHYENTHIAVTATDEVDCKYSIVLEIDLKVSFLIPTALRTLGPYHSYTLDGLREVVDVVKAQWIHLCPHITEIDSNFILEGVKEKC